MYPEQLRLNDLSFQLNYFGHGTRFLNFQLRIGPKNNFKCPIVLSRHSFLIDFKSLALKTNNWHLSMENK